MANKRIRDAYFNWIYDLVCGKRYSKETSYKKLLQHLHDIEFYWINQRDSDRAEDGIDLRYRFCQIHGIDIRDVDGLDDYPCSVLEMMVALAIRCEESIMDNIDIGDRTGQWFWGMIVSLGLGAMMDSRYDEEHVYFIIDNFLRRDYSPDGRGGLFTIVDCEDDLRNVSIWCQLCWYLDSI